MEAGGVIFAAELSSSLSDIDNRRLLQCGFRFLDTQDDGEDSTHFALLLPLPLRCFEGATELVGLTSSPAVESVTTLSERL